METAAKILRVDNSLKIEPVRTRTFDIPLVPVAKARPRFSRATGRAYTPAKTRHAQNETRDILEKEWAEEGMITDKPIVLDITFYLPRPKSKPKKKFHFPTVRPDIDNYLKLILDAMNGIVFQDDNLVIECAVRKIYADAGEPRTEVTVGIL